MTRLAALIALFAAPALAQIGDQLRPVPPAVLANRPYDGAGLPAEVEFINARRHAVRLYWIGFDGARRLYATIQPGEQVCQPTFVSHRWLVTRAASDAPVAAFIASRAEAHGDGQPQIAIIR